MPFRQKYTPNVIIRASRGWCLKYIDDAGKAPSRKPNARGALNVEISEKRLRTDTPPINVWVVGFLDLTAGTFAKDDHVFFMKYLGNGRYEIHDSESNSGARRVYGSINEIIAWFGSYRPKYVGWSTHCDGRQYVESYTAKKSDNAIANEVIDGKWGNGPARVVKLKAAGYNPNTIQALVNQKLSPKKPVADKRVFVTVKAGWGLSDVAKVGGYSDFGRSTRWAAIAKLNGSNNWQSFNVNLKPGQEVRVK